MRLSIIDVSKALILQMRVTEKLVTDRENRVNYNTSCPSDSLKYLQMGEKGQACPARGSFTGLFIGDKGTSKWLGQDVYNMYNFSVKQQDCVA